MMNDDRYSQSSSQQRQWEVEIFHGESEHLLPPPHAPSPRTSLYFTPARPVDATLLV